MGLIHNEIIFDFPAPKADKIIEEVSKLTGLSVIKLNPYENDNNVDEECECEESLYEFIQHISFKDFPKYYIQIYAYIPEAVNKLVKEEKQETGFDANWPKPIHGADEKDGKQSIYLKSYLGLEPTLFLATITALENLKGHLRYDSSETMPKDFFPVTVEELKQRYTKAKYKVYRGYLLIFISLPIIIPIWIVGLIIELIKMPFEIKRSMKEIKKHYPKQFKDK